MGQLAYQQAKIAGTALTYAAAGAGGDTVTPNDHGAVLVRNGSGASVNVTIAVPGNTRFGQPEPDVIVAVPAGADAAVGPFPSVLSDTDGLVHLSYSSAASVTVAAVQI